MRIMVYGDSNSFRPGGGKKSWPGILQKKIKSYVRVFNESCDGRTVGNDSGQYNGLADIQYRLDTYTSLDYIIIMLGTNDLKVEYGPPSPLKITQDMGSLIDAVESCSDNIKPILLTPPPIGMIASGHLMGAYSKVKHLAAEYRNLAINRDIPLVDIYSKLQIAADFENDMIHINSKGRQKIAHAVWSEISVQSTT